MVYCMTGGQWHDVWYGLAGKAWYMVWPGVHGIVHGWSDGHGMVYVTAWRAWHGMRFGLAAIT